jgi:hypothetical protein
MTDEPIRGMEVRTVVHDELGDINASFLAALTASSDITAAAGEALNAYTRAVIQEGFWWSACREAFSAGKVPSEPRSPTPLPEKSLHRPKIGLS